MNLESLEKWFFVVLMGFVLRFQWWLLSKKVTSLLYWKWHHAHTSIGDGRKCQYRSNGRRHKGFKSKLPSKRSCFWKVECWMKPQCRCVSQGKVDKLRQFFSPQKMLVGTQLQKKRKGRTAWIFQPVQVLESDRHNVIGFQIQEQENWRQFPRKTN